MNPNLLIACCLYGTVISPDPLSSDLGGLALTSWSSCGSFGIGCGVWIWNGAGAGADVGLGGFIDGDVVNAFGRKTKKRNLLFLFCLWTSVISFIPVRLRLIFFSFSVAALTF